jgi:hypothetical protein
MWHDDAPVIDPVAQPFHDCGRHRAGRLPGADEKNSPKACNARLSQKARHQRVLREATPHRLGRISRGQPGAKDLQRQRTQRFPRRLIWEVRYGHRRRGCTGPGREGNTLGHDRA